jgi:hypothetical protein
MERLILRAEPGTWPLWDSDGDAVSPEFYGLSDELLADLGSWNRRLAAADGWFQDDELEREFDDEGHALWERMTAELAGRYELAWQASFSDASEEPPAS